MMNLFKFKLSSFFIGFGVCGLFSFSNKESMICAAFVLAYGIVTTILDNIFGD